MTSNRPGSRLADNQPPPLVGHNVVTSDLALTDAVTRHATSDVLDDLIPLGAEAGSAEAREHGVLANTHRPELTTHDRYGNRIDEVALPPFVALAVGPRCRATASRPRPGSPTLRTPTYAARWASWPGRTPSPDTAARSR